MPASQSALASCAASRRGARVRRDRPLRRSAIAVRISEQHASPSPAPRDARRGRRRMCAPHRRAASNEAQRTTRRARPARRRAPQWPRPSPSFPQRRVRTSRRDAVHGSGGGLDVSGSVCTCLDAAQMLHAAIRAPSGFVRPLGTPPEALTTRALCSCAPGPAASSCRLLSYR
ncbi:hypothetical protein M885DRAFT_551016 [Pelagophyceae sp. CCMP2097]|nr:hypothetical protein M885DRAFT_551016 [Pelagophyceae sp. CCMP2097]